MESQIKFDILLKLAEHLEVGELGHKKFDFASYNSRMEYETDNKRAYPGCGYAGCAIGELPILFPEEWAFLKLGSSQVFNPWPLKLQNLDEQEWLNNPATYAAEFFGLSEAQCQHLFLPNCQQTRAYGGEVLSTTATKEEVASNIRAFILKMYK